MHIVSAMPFVAWVQARAMSAVRLGHIRMRVEAEMVVVAAGTSPGRALWTNLPWTPAADHRRTVTAVYAGHVLPSAYVSAARSALC